MTHSSITRRWINKFDGTGYFKFAIVNADGDTTCWSNDGTSTGGSEPADGISTTVSSGVFNVILGDTGITNMTALDKRIFSNGERLYLRVWFNDGTSGFGQLSPDRELTATAYVINCDAFRNTIFPTLTLNSDTTSGGDISIIANQGSSDNPEIRYDADDNQWKYSNKEYLLAGCSKN